MGLSDDPLSTHGTNSDFYNSGHHKLQRGRLQTQSWAAAIGKRAGAVVTQEGAGPSSCMEETIASQVAPLSEQELPAVPEAGTQEIRPSTGKKIHFKQHWATA